MQANLQKVSRTSMYVPIHIIISRELCDHVLPFLWFMFSTSYFSWLFFFYGRVYFYLEQVG